VPSPQFAAKGCRNCALASSASAVEAPESATGAGQHGAQRQRVEFLQPSGAKALANLAAWRVQHPRLASRGLGQTCAVATLGAVASVGSLANAWPDQKSGACLPLLPDLFGSISNRRGLLSHPLQHHPSHGWPALNSSRKMRRHNLLVTNIQFCPFPETTPTSLMSCSDAWLQRPWLAHDLRYCRRSSCNRRRRRDPILAIKCLVRPTLRFAAHSPNGCPRTAG